MPVISGLHAALSGLMAASTRASVSANNVANAQNSARPPEDTDGAAEFEGFRPRRVVQTNLAGGGTVAQPASVDPAFVLAFAHGDPNADKRGVVARPNVSEEREAVELIRASRAFEASARATETLDELSRTLIEAFGHER